jgi:hypothetical protein
MRYRLKSLLLLIAAVASVLAIGIYVTSVDWSYTRLASIDCGNGRTIHIYEETFCDFATFPVYDVEIDGKIVSQKYTTGLYYDCGNRVELDSARAVLDNTRMLVAIVRGENDLIAIYDFDLRKNVELPTTGKIADIPAEILARLDLKN